MLSAHTQHGLQRGSVPQQATAEPSRPLVPSIFVELKAVAAMYAA